MNTIPQPEDYLQDEPFCVYCEQIREVRPWNGELVCYECRAKFLDKEFDREPVVLENFESVKKFLESVGGF